MRSTEFLAGLLDPAGPEFVTAEDLDGPHREAVRAWQARGFIAAEPGVHPAPSCPHCDNGHPSQAEGRTICVTCRSSFDASELRAWPVRREAVHAAVAAQLALRGGTQPVGPDLWELGSGTVDGATTVCFYHPGGSVSEPARRRLAAFRRVLVLHRPAAVDPTAPGRWVSLAEVLHPDGTFATLSLGELVRVRGRVRFDVSSGTVRVGSQSAGEVLVGSREWALLTCLADRLDQFVPYRDLKREVLARTGGSAGVEEATFCQKLKSRIKEKYIPSIDRLVVTSNKGDGYRLRESAI